MDRGRDIIVSEETAPTTGPATAGQAGRVDAVCDRFEAAFKAGREPRLEDYAGAAAGPEGRRLLRELLALDLELRRRRGERPDPRVYRMRFPGHAELIDAVFAEAATAPRAGSTAPTARGEPDEGVRRLGAIPDAETREGPGTTAAGRTEDRILEEERTRPDAATTEAASTDEALPHPGGVDRGGGRFQILRSHAQGGLGEIFVAEDGELAREVALKEIRPLHAHDPGSRARFFLEARITGGLEHPGIVPIYSLGIYADGCPFYAMRLIRGESLKEAIQRFHRVDGTGSEPGGRALAFRELLGRFVAVCNAVAYAHSRGVVHRDLKPANVMLGPYGETLVVDWGLAKPLGQEQAATLGRGSSPALRPLTADGSTPTETGSALGTPAYMSPEQSVGDWERVGPRSDVYSLGATLYSLLTGRAAFEGDDILAVLDRVRRGEFRPPRQVEPEIPPALEAICLKAMATRPEARYATAGELADEIERWLADEPVAAYREPWGPRLARWARRHKPWVTGAAALLATAIVALAVGTVLIDGARRGEKAARGREADQRRLAEAARQAEAEARRQAEAQLYLSNVALAGREWRAGNAARVGELLNECAADLRHWEWHYLKRQGRAGRRTLVGPHFGRVTALAFSPDGTRLVSSGQHGTVKVWDAGEARVVLDLDRAAGHKGHVLGAAYCRDGRRIATAGEDGTVRLWDAATGRPGPVLRGHEAAVSAVAFSPDGSRLASAGRDGVLKLWDPATGADRLTLRGHGAAVSAVAFSPDGSRLASAGEYPDTVVRVWDVATGAEARRLTGHAVNVNGLSFSPDGRRLASAGNDGSVLVWDVADGKAVATLAAERRPMVNALAYSPDGKYLASGGLDQVVRVWDVGTGREVWTLRGHASGVTALAFRPDGRSLASADEDGVIQIWDPIRGPESVPIAAEDVRHAGLAISPDGRWIAAATQGYPAGARGTGTAPERTVRLWDAADGRPGPVLRGHDEDLTDVAFSPDGVRLAAAGDRGTVTVWEVSSGRILRTLRRPEGPAVRPMERGRVAFGPGAGQLVLVDDEGTATVWATDTGREAHTYRTARPSQSDPTGRIRPALALGLDGRRLAVGDLSGVRLWDLADGREIATLRGGLAAILAMAFSPDGGRLALAAIRGGGVASAGEIQVWDVATGREVVAFSGAAGGTHALAFTPDGRRLASTGFYHRDVVLWDASGGRELLALPIDDSKMIAGPGTGSRLAFGPDGARLALVGLNGASTWDATPGPEVLTLHAPVSLWGLDYSPDGRRLAAADNHDAATIRDAASGRVLLTLPVPDVSRGMTLLKSKFSPDSTRVAVAVATPSSGRVVLWDAATGRVAGQLTGHAGPVINLAFRPDGRRIATASHDRTARVWDAATCREIRVLGPRADRVNGVAYSPDGTRLAIACRDGTITLWDDATGAERATLRGHRGSVVDVAFSPDGRRLASAGGRRSDQSSGPPGEVKIWDLANSREKSDLPGLTAFIYGVAFSPDGRSLATAGEDRTVRVWEVATGRERLALRGHHNDIRRVTFRPDGRSIASCGEDRTVRVWDLAPPTDPFGRSPADEPAGVAGPGTAW